MKKIIFILFVVSFFASCQKNLIEEINKKTVTIGAQIENTKTQISDDGIVTWCEGDVLQVVRWFRTPTNFGSKQYRFSICSGAGTNQAFFSAPSSFPEDDFSGGYKYRVASCKPGKASSFAYNLPFFFDDKEVTSGYGDGQGYFILNVPENQTYFPDRPNFIENGIIPMYGCFDSSISGAKDNITLHYAAAIIKLTLMNTTGSEVCVSKITLSTDVAHSYFEGIAGPYSSNGKFGAELSFDGYYYNAGIYSIVLNCNNERIGAGESKTFSFVTAFGYNGNRVHSERNLTFTVQNGEEVEIGSYTKHVPENGVRNGCIYTVNASLSAVPMPPMSVSVPNLVEDSF